MKNVEILHILTDEIEETINTSPQKIFESNNGIVLTHLKNFDYYYVFCIINPSNHLVNQYIKLPEKFVQSCDKDHKDILNKFLEITGVLFASHNNQYIVNFTGKDKQIWMNPLTYNRTKYMVFGLEKKDTVEHLFTVDIIKYRDFLESYNIRH